jgi:hypothetical protein
MFLASILSFNFQNCKTLGRIYLFFFIRNKGSIDESPYFEVKTIKIGRNTEGVLIYLLNQ